MLSLKENFAIIFTVDMVHIKQTNSLNQRDSFLCDKFCILCTWFSLTTGSAGALNPLPGRKGRAIFFITKTFHDPEPFSFSLI